MTTRWQHFSRRHQRLLDAVLVVVLFVLSGPVAYYSSKSYADGLGWWSALPLAAVATAAVPWRRSHPHAVVLVTAVCAGAAGGVGYLLTPMLLAPVLVALYSFAAQVPPRRAYRFCLPVTAMVVLSTVFGDRYGHPWPLATVNPVLCLLLPVALGSATRIRNAYLEAVETRAKYAEQTREEEAGTGWPKNVCASPVNSTMSSPTISPSPTPRPGRSPSSPGPVPTRSPRW